MIMMRTWLTVAAIPERGSSCAFSPRWRRGIEGRAGDIVTGPVKEATPESQIKEGKVVKWRHRGACARKPPQGRHVHPLRRPTPRCSSTIPASRWGTPRIWSVARELREKKFTKIVSLLPEVW